MMLELLDVSVNSRDRTVLKPFSLQIKPGEIVLIVGPSGSGKSTLLSLIAGFISVGLKDRSFGANRWFAGSDTGLLANGKLLYGGKDITHVRPEERGFGMVNQKYSVYPHLSGLENIAFPMKCRGLESQERMIRAHQLAEMVQLSQESRKQKAGELSGGEQQRVAIAKMLAREATIGLLDEPFSHLDPVLRKELTALILSIIKTYYNNYFNTALIVSHDWSDIQYAHKVILVVDSRNQSENVITLERYGDLFQTSSSLDSLDKERWIYEINAAFGVCRT